MKKLFLILLLSFWGITTAQAIPVFNEIPDDPTTQTTTTRSIDTTATTGTTSTSTTHRKHGLDIEVDSTEDEYTDSLQQDVDSPQDEYIETTSYENDFSSNCIDFSPAMRVIGILVLILKIAIPLIIIVVATVNMFNTITSGKSDDFNNIVKKTAFSIVGGILIFLSPTIVDLVMNAVTRIANKPSTYTDIEMCLTCINHPTSDECSEYIELSKQGSYGKSVLIKKPSSTTTTTTQSVKHGGGGGGGSVNAKYAPHKGPISLPITKGAGLWIAHQKNSTEKINKAVNDRFYGIEVDVAYINGEFILHHANTTGNGAKLIDFLKIARKNGILAVLDLKNIAGKYSELVSIVKKNYSIDSVIFMAMEKNKLNGIYNIDSQARLWYINGVSTTAPNNYFNKDEMTQEFIDKIEGVAVLALLVDKDIVDWAHNNGLTIEAFSYLDYMYPGTPVTKLREWGVDYVSANEIDED